MNAGAKPKNWRNALLPLAHAILHASDVGSRFADAIDSFREAWRAFDRDERPPEQALWEQAFALAVADALRTSRVDVQQNPDELQAAVADFLAEAFASETGFGEAELLDPTGFAAYQPVRAAFPDFVRRIDPAYAVEPDERLRERLDTALRQGLVRAWSDDVQHVQVIVDRLQGPIAEGARREAAWMRHYAWVRAKFEREPVFSPDDDLPVRLEQVYVRLRCVWHEAEDDDADERATHPLERRKRRAHVGLLHDEVRAWLDAAAPDDPIRIVAGGPGSGKSSFARAFATEAILETGWRVVFVELQHLPLTADLRKDVRHYFDLRKASGAGFKRNAADDRSAYDPLDWYGTGTPYLLVFDGLDELAVDQATATDITRRFVANLKRMLRQMSGDAPLKALVLGRSTAAAEARRDSELPLRCLLHALPLRPPTRSDLLLDGDGEAEVADDVVDRGGLLAAEGVDQRRVYWQRWHQTHGLPAESVPEGLTDDTLAELTAEPLLLHLLIVSGYLTPDRWQEAADNRNVVYEAIFTEVYERDRSAGRWTAAKIDRADFFTLMECLGLAAWAGGGRTGSEDEFLRLRATHATGTREQKFQQLASADLRTAALQFYARRDLDKPGYEFIHKSFGEYLIARGVLATAQRTAGCLPDVREAGVATGWVEITGLAELTEEILHFLRDEVRLLSLGDTIALEEQLQRLMSWTLRHGMPAHGLGDVQSFRLVEARQRHAEGALLAVLNACARRIAPDDVGRAAVFLDWPHALALKQLVERLRLGRDNFSLEIAFDHLAGRSMSLAEADACHPLEHWLPSTDLSDMSFDGASLKGANLWRSNLSGTSLVDVDLRDGVLVEAVLERANLRGANLSDADLSDANLLDATLVGVNLEDANLTGASLHGADLRKANLRGANLTDAILRGATLCKACLCEANLAGADLRGTDLQYAELVETKLSRADLRRARGLSQHQVETARGDANTRLPDAVVRPVHWT